VVRIHCDGHVGEQRVPGSIRGRERPAGGHGKAKAAGVYKGRPPSIEASVVRELKEQGMRPSDIAKALKIGRASVYRILASSG
jgi:DNA invertase Pin-like site-specific DNA recombinase